MLDAVLFDLDGTLTDPAIGIIGSYRHAFASVGHPVDDSVDLRWMIGPPLRENFIRHGLPEHLHDDAVVAYRTRHTEVGLFEAAMIPGILDVLQALTADGIPLALATAKPVRQANTTLEHFAIESYFKVVAGGVVDGLPRSKSLIVADALEGLGMRVGSTVAMVGDRQYDINGGRSNGCITVAVEWGYAEPGELDEVMPDHRVADPGALLDALRSIARR